jgi:hypothetical protein
MKLNVKTLLLLLTIALSIISSNASSTKNANKRRTHVKSLTKRSYAYVTSKGSLAEFGAKLVAAFTDPNNYFKFVCGVLSEPFPELNKLYSQVETAAPIVAPCFLNAFRDNTPEPSGLSAGAFGDMLAFAQKAYKWKDAIVQAGQCIKEKFKTSALKAVKDKLFEFFDAGNILLQAGKIALNVVGNIFSFGIAGAVKGSVAVADLVVMVADFWKNPNTKTAWVMGQIVGKCIYMILAFLGIGRKRKMKLMRK